MPLERPCTGSANPRTHSDPVLAMRRIARNVFLKERGSLYEKKLDLFRWFVYLH